MKNQIISALLTAAMFTALVTTASADIKGAVYTTDIGAVIDGNPIKSYNISDSTYIKAEDLRGYGFDVVWNAEAFTLTITPDDLAVRTVLDEDEINIKKADIPVHQKLYDVYSTDIKTYLNGTELNACNINGETLVKFADLASVGYVNYSDADRLASLDVIKYRLDKAFDSAEDKEELTLADGITYTGQVKDGKPNGVGRTYDKSRIAEFPGTINDITKTAFYTDGEIDGMYALSGTYQYTIGSSLGTYTKTNTGNTKINYQVLTDNYHVDKDFYYEISTIEGMPQYYENGVLLRGGWDNSYLYCVSSEVLPNVSSYTVYTDGDAGLIPSELPKFSKFNDEKYFDTKAVSEDGKLYTLPYGEDYRVAVEYAEEPKSNPHYIENGVLYEDFDDGTGARAIDTDVKMFDGTNYMIYLKNDGSVWTYRANAAYGEWIDGLDYSKPVKRAEDAKYVSCDDGFVCMYIKNDDSLWGFGLSEYGELGYKEEVTYATDDRIIDYNEVYGREHIKIGDGFVSCKAGYVCLALDKDNNLWAWGDNEDARIEKGGETVITEPVKLSDNVKDYVCSSAIYIIKNDGTLWYKGNPYYYRQRYIDETIDEFTECKAVYKK